MGGVGRDPGTSSPVLVWGPQPCPVRQDYPLPQSPRALPGLPLSSPPRRIHSFENHYSAFPHLCQVPSKHIGVLVKPSEMTNKYFNHHLKKIRFKIKTLYSYSLVLTPSPKRIELRGPKRREEELGQK